MPNPLLGNDVAHHQGNINFDVYKNNTNFLIIKATEGTGYRDPKFIRNRDEARRVGLLLGYYHFARPDLNANPISEADWFLQTLGQIREGEMLVLDYEPAGQKQEWVDWCKRWLDHVFSRTGCRPLIYLNQSQVRKFNWQSVVDGGYGLWIAAYTYDPKKNDFEKGQWKFAAMQQWTNRQNVPGIAGNTDGNVFFGDENSFKKYGFPAQASSSVSPSQSPSSSVSSSPSEAPVDWEKKYKDEVTAHAETKRRLQSAKDFVAQV